MKLCYVTENDLKIKLAKKIFRDLGIEVVQNTMDVPEIQSLDCEEVSRFSSKWACEKLGIPVIKNDSGICFEGLNNFPGALSKYTEDTIGPNGFIKLLEDKDNKKCYWIEVISYCEPGMEPVSFCSYSYGTISDSVREGRGWGYDKIFIPKGDNRTFSEMTEDEQLNCFSEEAYINLYKYLKRKKADN